jgi:imidazolonepropionase-like amidohydrolase
MVEHFEGTPILLLSEKRWRTELGSRILFLAGRSSKALNRQHAVLLAGTDTPNPLLVPGFSLHDELRNLQAAGLTNFEVLRTATTNPAAFLGISTDSGTVEVGKRADLCLG